MTRLKLIALVCAAHCLPGVVKSQAAYYLDNARSTDGMYAYETAPAASPGGSDEGQGKIFSFAEGALMDGVASNLGKGVAFPHLPRGSQMKRLYIDLGQEVTLQSLAVKSHLDEWWTIGPFYAELAGRDGHFYYKARHAGAELPIPHAPGISPVCRLNIPNLPARYLKLTFIVPMWNHTRIDELEITAVRPGQNTPPAGPPDQQAFRAWFDGHTRPPVVDPFGQWVHDAWPGKIHDEAELAKRLNDEVARYAKVERDPATFDRFGGSKTLGLAAPATGKWRLKKINRRWWFITPDGNPFILIGADGANCWGVNTVEHPDRPELPSLFAWLPPRDGRFAGAWVFSLPEKRIGRFDFFQANLIRCWGTGEAMSKKHYDLMQRRLWDWGFNTLGKWSDVNPALAAIGRPMPYILPIGATPPPGVVLRTINGLEDPWDPNYVPAVEAAIKQIRDTRGADPYLIGIAFYGENWWGNAATGAMLKGPADSPAKRAFCQRLATTERSGLAALNRRLGTSWKSLDAIYAADLTPYAAALKNELSVFIEHASSRYFGAWRHAIDRYDPGRLLLGACFVPTWIELCSDEWIRGSIPHCDAMMLDDYSLEPAAVLQTYVATFAVPADKPVILGEYSVTTCERGFNAFGTDVVSQADRGKAYRRLNEAFFAHPNWVGAMWFLYRDEVLLGRDEDGYGECHNFGLVDVCNLPYYDMIGIMKAANRTLFEIHAGTISPERGQNAPRKGSP